MEIRKAQAMVNEFYGQFVTNPTMEALLIVLVQAELIDRQQLRFIQKWVEDANRKG